MSNCWLMEAFQTICDAFSLSENNSTWCFLVFLLLFFQSYPFLKEMESESRIANTTQFHNGIHQRLHDISNEGACFPFTKSHCRQHLKIIWKSKDDLNRHRWLVCEWKVFNLLRNRLNTARASTSNTIPWIKGRQQPRGCGGSFLFGLHKVSSVLCARMSTNLA